MAICNFILVSINIWQIALIITIYISSINFISDI